MIFKLHFLIYRNQDYVNCYLELGFLVTLGFLLALGFLGPDGVRLDLQKLHRRLKIKYELTKSTNSVAAGGGGGVVRTGGHQQKGTKQEADYS